MTQKESLYFLKIYSPKTRQTKITIHNLVLCDILHKTSMNASIVIDKVANLCYNQSLFKLF